MTRALVVDDSQFMRTVVGSQLSDEGFEVIEASNGERAIEAVDEHDPDVITMDVQMPEMDGIQATEYIMSWKPTPILMVSAHTEEGAEATFDALERGAVDFLTKPDGEVSIETGSMEAEIVEKVEAVAKVDATQLSPFLPSASADAPDLVESDSGSGSASVARVATETAIGADAALGMETSLGADPSTARPRETSIEDISSVIEAQLSRSYVENPTIVVGASTGGPKVISRMLRELPRALDARVLAVQHMPASFTSRFATRLDSVSAYDVAEAEDGERIGGGQARIARGDSHLEVTNYSSGRLRLRQFEGGPIDGVRPSIDLAMTSAAETVTDHLVGVALTGMGDDGADGIAQIKGAGGHTIAQDEASSPVYGIPQQATRTGAVDEVVGAADLVEGIVAACTVDEEDAYGAPDGPGGERDG